LILAKASTPTANLHPSKTIKQSDKGEQLMTTERWDDERLDQLANLAENNARTIENISHMVENNTRTIEGEGYPRWYSRTTPTIINSTESNNHTIFYK
jgi:hypothetical protein